MMQRYGKDFNENFVRGKSVDTDFSYDNQQMSAVDHTKAFN